MGLEIAFVKVGEDAAAFDSSKQSAAKWTFFTAELAVVLAILYAVSSSLAHQIQQFENCASGMICHIQPESKHPCT